MSFYQQVSNFVGLVPQLAIYGKHIISGFIILFLSHVIKNCIYANFSLHKRC